MVENWSRIAERPPTAWKWSPTVANKIYRMAEHISFDLHLSKAVYLTQLKESKTDHR